MQGDKEADLIAIRHPAPEPWQDSKADPLEDYFLRTGKRLKPVELTRYVPPKRKKSKPLFSEPRRDIGF